CARTVTTDYYAMDYW
nr:immunoglobulin heavy chain junction region [Mus musculus]